MPLFEKHPQHIRRKIALLCTGVVALILLGLLILYYTSPKRNIEKGEPSKLHDFYDSISEDSESLFDRN